MHDTGTITLLLALEALAEMPLVKDRKRKRRNSTRKAAA